MIRFMGPLLLAGVCGCDAISIVVPPRTTTVRLVNSGEFTVEATVAFDDEQEIPEDLLTEIGTEMDFTIPAGGTRSFTRDCDDLQAVMVEQADLVLIGEVGPETDSGVLRDGDDFSCGDTVTFTFVHSALIVDFDVLTDVNPE